MTVLGPGSLVRCVDVSQMSWPEDMTPFRLGGIYRVSKMKTLFTPKYGEMVVVTLVEYGERWWFAASRFVPVDDGAIDVFRSLLAPVPRESKVGRREKEKA